jgi:flagellar export protein FliJ
MTRFRFRLERVQHIRRIELDREEAKLRQYTLEIGELEKQQAQLDQAAARAEVEVRAPAELAGSDLAALAGFRRYLAGQTTQLAQRIREARERAEAQQKILLEARRRCELLERLKQKRLAEWQSQADRELEQIAAESYLANTTRRPK